MDFSWSVFFAFLGGLSVSIVTMVGNIINTKINHKHELKKTKQTQMLELSFKDYEMISKINEKLVEKGEDIDTYPWELHYLSHKRVMELFENEELSTEELKDKLYYLLLELRELKIEFETVRKF